MKKRKRTGLHGRGRVECIFQCPAKGRVELRVYPRKGETLNDTCRRALLETRIDPEQVPLCQKVRIKVLD